MKTISKEEVQNKLELHTLWLQDDPKGNRLTLPGYNLTGTNLTGANLTEANLTYADLTGANLRDTRLFNCVGNGSQLLTLQTEKYIINYTKEDIQIGCEKHTLETWFNFTDEKIIQMDQGALEWWNKHKEWLKLSIELNPAK